MEIMIKFRLFLVILLQVCSFSLVWNACILLNDCPSAVKYIEKRRNDPKTRKILLNAHCGLEQRNGRTLAKVYCDRIPEFVESPKTTNKNDLLPKKNECGIQAPVNKIFVGQRAEFEDFPWLALLQYKNKTNHLAFRCHGSLISKRYVVTAAHCLSYPSRDKVGNIVKVVLGEYDIATPVDCLPGYCIDPVQSITPESVHFHPNFGSTGALSDIGLVRLRTEASFSDYVKPICLPFGNINLRQHDPLLISGWGKTETRIMSNVKLKAKIYYLRNEECPSYDVDDTQICAGSPTGADTCKGDSGGPLAAVRQTQNRENQNILIGVVSYGGSCGSGSAIYTNVTLFVKWILDTIHE